MKNQIKNQKNNQKIIFVLLLAIIGVAILLIGAYSKNEEKTGADYYSEGSMDADAYAEYIEKRICELCERIDGVGEVCAVVTLDGGYSTVYAQNSQSGSSGYKNEFVLTGSGSSEKALLVGYSTPKVSGVGIVCRGGGNDGIKKEIISLISATFGVSSNKIYVTEAGG